MDNLEIGDTAGTDPTVTVEVDSGLQSVAVLQESNSIFKSNQSGWHWRQNTPVQWGVFFGRHPGRGAAISNRRGTQECRCVRNRATSTRGSIYRGSSELAPSTGLETASRQSD